MGTSLNILPFSGFKGPPLAGPLFRFTPRVSAGESEAKRCNSEPAETLTLVGVQTPELFVKSDESSFSSPAVTRDTCCCFAEQMLLKVS